MTSDNSVESKNSKDITDFFLSEYEHIATAHFESSKQIVSFFRYYLLIVSAPAFIFLLFDKQLDKVIDLLKGNDIGVNWFVFMFYLIISVIGYLVFVYITKIKFDNILYARTVNGIRNYFKVKSKDPEVESYFVLPLDISKPSYFQWNYLAIVFSFTIINSSIVFLAFWIINWKCPAFLSSLFFAVLHLVTYLIWAKTKTNRVR